MIFALAGLSHVWKWNCSDSLPLLPSNHSQGRIYPLLAYPIVPAMPQFSHAADALRNLFPQAKKRPLWCGIGLAITRSGQNKKKTIFFRETFPNVVEDFVFDIHLLFCCCCICLSTSFGLFIMCLPHFLTGYNHIDTQVGFNYTQSLEVQPGGYWRVHKRGKRKTRSVRVRTTHEFAWGDFFHPLAFLWFVFSRVLVIPTEVELSIGEAS